MVFIRDSTHNIITIHIANPSLLFVNQMSNMSEVILLVINPSRSGSDTGNLVNTLA